MMTDAIRIIIILGLLAWFQHRVQAKQTQTFVIFPFALLILLVNDITMMYPVPALISILCIGIVLTGYLMTNTYKETVLDEPKEKDNNTLPLPVIMDGQIQYSKLQQINQNEFWLRRKIRDLGYKDIKQISYCSVRGDQLFYIDVTEKK